MNNYEAKLEARRIRYQQLSEQAKERSKFRYQQSNNAVACIPLGQPILLNHHSEGKHRSALKKSHYNMGKSIEEQKKADYYANRAAGVGHGGISSDDEDAITKIERKIAATERLHVRMKAANKVIKAGVDVREKLKALGMTEEEIISALKPDYMGRTGYRQFELTSNTAEIRRLKARVKELKEKSEMQYSETDMGNGITKIIDPEENRIRLSFPGKPDDKTRERLKSLGFKWSPANQAWQRHLNGNGLFSTDLFFNHQSE